MQTRPTRRCFRVPRMIRCPFMVLGLSAFFHAAGAQEFPTDPTGWPAIGAVNKPWTRWWWLGSGVDKPNITRELEAFAKAGIGGVEICPIYQAVGAEDRSLEFLSPQWLEMLAHTTTEARRLGLSVDMTTGTGWPFGGPMVAYGMASWNLQRISIEAVEGKRILRKLPAGTLQYLAAFPENGGTVDLTKEVKDGQLDWTPPAGKWKIFGLCGRSPIQKVKRAAPGGEGDVLDPFSPDAMNRYLTAFESAFKEYKAPMPRAQFHDSFEYYGAEWTPGLFGAFQARRGYDLRDQLPAFNGSGDPDVVTRVRADYRETLGELHRDYLKAWHDWTRKNGGVTRNQAHGSPGNLLDHYAVSEIPETEIFRHVADEQIPMLRFAASAAHSNGGNLVSSESFTWLGEHFQVTPEQLKEAADFVFLGGVNHLFFHGIPYSPADAPWPGWLFYASTHMGPNGGLWRNLPAFTGYMQRCQSILQDGRPSSEVLLYFPFSDLTHQGQAKLPLFTVHNQSEWLQPLRFYQTAMELWNHGITFDFASDDMLRRATVTDGKIVLGNNVFKALVLPGVRHLPIPTLGHLTRLASQGGAVIVQDGWPTEVPGFHEHQKRRAALQATPKGKCVETQGSILPSLATHGVLRERLTESGLRFIRREHAGGYHYFIVNRSGKLFEGPLPLAVPFKSAVVLDPWKPEQAGIVSSGEIPMRLEPLQSVIIRTFTHQSLQGTPWSLPGEVTQTIQLEGPWKIEFVEGGPILPKPAEMPTLASWTQLAEPAAANFSGTATYSTTFDFTGAAGTKVRIELGKVANTARVHLNGSLAGISWCQPHVLDLSPHVKTGRNQLTIEVTNLAANRIADLDRRKVPWKQFHEINFVNIDYKSFDASNWPPLNSGLLGPVRLLCETLKP